MASFRSSDEIGRLGPVALGVGGLMSFTYPVVPFNSDDYRTMIPTVFTYRISSRTLNTTIPVTNTP